MEYYHPDWFLFLINKLFTSHVSETLPIDNANWNILHSVQVSLKIASKVLKVHIQLNIIAKLNSIGRIYTQLKTIAHKPGQIYLYKSR